MTASDASARINRRRGLWQLLWVLAFVGGAFGVARFLAGRQVAPLPEQETASRELLVETVRVRPQSHRLRFSATGTVEAQALTDIVPQISGKVVAVADEAFAGGRITPETAVFEIEAVDYRLRLRRIQADVARARTQLKLQQAASRAAEKEWRRLHPDTPAPPLVAEQPQLAQAQAALRAAEAQLEAARLNLSRTVYRLPFTGRIAEFNLNVGQYVVAGRSYGRAYGLEALEIEVPVDAQQLQWLTETDDPRISITGGRAGPAVYEGVVKRISSTVDPATRFSRVYVGIREPGPGIVPGVFVTVDVAGPVRTNVWVLPLDALQDEGKIWTVTSEGRLSARRPDILQLTSSNLVARSDGDPIQVVRGHLGEATEGTPARITGEDQPEERSDDAGGS